jgi:Flp pilus assembly protein TadB
MRMRIEAGRARTRTSVRVIVGTTLTFAAAVVLLNRPYLSAYDTVVGQIVLLGIGILFGLGFAWLARIATVSEPLRALTGDPAPATAASETALVIERQV